MRPKFCQQACHAIIKYGYRRPLPNLISTSTPIAPPMSPRSRRTSSRTARRTSSGSEMNACPGKSHQFHRC